ncbi:protein-L-isoaspartate(D-aspartate) O-methyltransferase [Desulfatibacillum aliphaticivorans]|uniref:protein-L-isoaspartate(D-aspartate) O-methyltransferase n=1 Tax=Desulfatibacillum aliphaticivorans TaxID=218208 RepID=UPI00040830D3|nr:protein-L-isoaspartate(D-aspartate) O-methyltransferase [Desulfatibacillum aliphaticivorans]
MGPKVLIALALAGGLFWASAVLAGGNAPGPDYQKLREQMVYSQIEKRGVKDAGTLAAMRKVERRLFVPESYRSQAYNDYPLPIGEGQTISQPYIVALMTQVLELDGSEKVLEIGTGSGYQAAVLGELAREVYTMEIVEPLGERAAKILAQLHYDNVKVKVGDGYKGWPEHAPFDAIIVTCAPTDIPAPLVEQLAEGGRMVIPVGEAGNQNLVLLTKINGKVKEKKIIPVRFVPMTRENGSVY